MYLPDALEQLAISCRVVGNGRSPLGVLHQDNEQLLTALSHAIIAARDGLLQQQNEAIRRLDALRSPATPTTT